MTTTARPNSPTPAWTDYTVAFGFYETLADLKAGGLEIFNHYAASAMIWNLHIPYRDIDVQRGLVRLLTSVATGEVLLREGVAKPIGWVGGDSWTEWNEPYQEDEDFRALHIYFEATPDTAREAGTALATFIGSPHGVIVTTAGDWSEDAK